MSRFYLSTTFVKHTRVLLTTLPSWYPRIHHVVVKNNKNMKNIELGMVWEVMELFWEVITDPYSTLYLHKCINRRREVHERGLELWHYYTIGIGTFIPPTFALDVVSLCCRAWRLSSLEKRNNITISRFCEVPSLRRR